MYLPYFFLFFFRRFRGIAQAETISSQTDCGMLLFTDEVLRGKIRSELGQNADHVAFLPFGDLRQSVLDDVKLLKENPLVLDVPITGYLYEVESGRIVKVE